MVYVYAATVRDARVWATREGIRLRDLRAVGAFPPSAYGIQYREGDRIVFLGEVPPEVAAAVHMNRMKSPGGPPIERIARA